MRRIGIAALLMIASASALPAQTNAPITTTPAPAVTAAAPGEVTRLTFDEALRRAMQVNNAIERSRAEINVAEAQRSYLLSSVMPRIALGGALTRNSMEQSFGGEGPDAVTILPRNDWNSTLTLSQPIYAGRREFRAYSQAKIGIESAREGVLVSEDLTLLRVASAYLGVINADRRIAVERGNIEIAEKRRTQAQAFYEAGEVTRVDVLRADTAVKAAQRMVASAQQTRERAVSELRALLDLNGPIEVTDPGQTLPPMPSEAELVRRAENDRPDVDVAENDVRIAQLEVQKQRGFWFPTVTFDGGWVNQRTPFPASSYAFGALRFNVPIFQAGEVQARVAGAKERELQSRLALEDTRTTAREDVRKALVDLQAAEISLGLAREQLAAAEAEYEQAFDLYRAQEATSLDVSTSEASLAEARRAIAEETLNRDLAELRVWYAAGVMKEAVGMNAGPASTPDSANQPTSTVPDATSATSGKTE